MKSSIPHSIICLVLITQPFLVKPQTAAYIPADFKGEAPSSNGCFIRNQGQLRTLQETAAARVTAYSMQFVPQLFVEKDNILSVALGTRDTIIATVDTIVKFNIEFFGPNLNTQSYISYHEPLDDRYNFLLGHLSAPLMGLTSYRRLIYRDVFPNIDVHVYSNQMGPKLYMVMRPGANPTDLRMRFVGQDSLIMDAFGFLRPYVQGRYIVLPRGLCYQEINGDLVMVHAQLGYQLNTGTAEVNFQPVSYNNAHPLIIDISASLGPQGGGEVIPPKWATYYGHTENDRASDGTVLPNGGLLVVGTTYSPAFPLEFAEFGTFDGSRMAYVSEFDGQYKREYTTFFGGNGVDNGNSIALAPGGQSFYLFGETTSNNLQMVNPGNGAFMDNTPQLYNGYIAKLSRANPFETPAEWVTYFGAGIQSCSSIRTASNGEVYILGDTRAFGPAPDPETTCQGTTGTFPICNQLGSSAFIQTFPNSPNDGDAYFCRFNANLNLVQSTFFGGSSADHGNKIAVDNAAQRVYIIGTTNSIRQAYTNCQPTGAGFPLCNPGGGAYFQQNLNGTNSQNGGLHFDAYVASFSTNGALDWSTFFGGWHTENGFATTVNPVNQSLYLGGFSQTSFGYATNDCSPPTTNGFPSCAAGNQEQYPYAGGGSDAYVARFGLGDRSLKWSTFLGRGGIDGLDAMGWDEGGNIWLGGVTQGGGSVSGTIPLATLNGVYSQDLHADEGGSEVKYDGMFYSFSPTDVLRHGSYFGGRGNDDDVRIMAPSASGQLYMGGSSGSDADFPFACPPTPDPYCYLTYATLLPNTTESFYTDLRHGTDVGMDEGSVSMQPMHVYPNPTTGTLTLALPENVSGTIAVNVFDAQGKLALAIPTLSVSGSAPVELKLGDLPSGMYLLRAEQPQGAYYSNTTFILE